MTSTTAICREIVELLATRQWKVVLAESCTAGLVSASLARIPGVSSYLCGSLVTYRSETKAAWLQIPSALLKSPGPVSKTVARQMALGALEKTPEANVAASVTGHLGPHAPPRLDGVIYVGLAIRDEKVSPRVTRWQLPPVSRAARQREAARIVLTSLRDRLAEGV